jgi:Zn-dependent peptidase ImmA (M78 family)/DNA-binding XRE family transcriptional regulator
MSHTESRESIIIGAQLQKARDLLQLTLEEVALEVSTTSQDIAYWEAEKSRPTLKQLEDLARLYGREIDYFLRVTPVPPKDIEFRGKPGKHLKDLPKETRIVLARFDELCRTALEFESLLNKRQVINLPRFIKDESPKKAAEIFRERFNANDRPFSDLRQRLENEGTRIFELPVLGDAFSGISFWHKEYGPCILLNTKEPIGRKNFTLAHELAHLLYNDGSSICYIPSKIEISIRGLEYKANHFAIEVLLPESGILEDFKKRNISSSPAEKELAQIASRWGVSIQALGYRLENLDLIDIGITDRVVEIRSRYFRRPKVPAWRRQLGKRFVENSIEAYQSNLISVGRLAHSLRIPIRKAMEIVEEQRKQG